MPTTGKSQGIAEFSGGKNPSREKSGNFEKMGEIRGKIREFYKNMPGKFQGIFDLFHDIKNHRNDDIYDINVYSFFMKPILTLLWYVKPRNMVNKWLIIILSC